jgi:hypothetical protein
VRPSLRERFWSKVRRNGSTPGAIQTKLYPELKGTRCWPYTAALDDWGYGMFSYQGQNIHAHRMAYFLTNGVFPEPIGLHKCDNMPCCNPNHVYSGTQGENNRDTYRKGRHRNNAKLTPADVCAIRKALSKGITGACLARQYEVCKSTITNVKGKK